MVEGPDRVVAAGEAFAGGAGITLHAQGKLQIAVINYGYVTLGLARADVASQAAAVATARQTALENSELGMYFAHRSNPFLGKVGIVLPTGPETSFAAAGVAVEDTVLAMSRAAGVRATAARRDVLALGSRRRVALRADAGIDVVETLADEHWHAIPHGGLGVGYGSEQLELVAATAIAYAPLALGDSHTRWSGGLTARGNIGSDRRRLGAGLTLAAIHDVTGWGGSLTLELAFTNARR